MIGKQWAIKHSEQMPWVQALIPDAVRGGWPQYWFSQATIRRFNSYSEKEIEQRTFENLRGVLLHAADRVPFYQTLYRQKGFDAKSVQSMDDWKHVPVVTKQDLREYPIEERCVPGLPGKLANTGGTSGAPLSFMLGSNMPANEWAHMHSIWKARGYRSSQLKVRFGGAYRTDGTPIWYHPRHNEYVVNTNCGMEEIAQALLSLPTNHAVRWLHGYPSLIAEFAHTLVRCRDDRVGWLRKNLFGVLLSSEFPAPIYRDPISQVLSSNIVTWYGHTEQSVLAKETALGLYESLPSYGYAEAIPHDTSSSVSNLVCTSLHNRCHPFIRYDTGDLIEPVLQQGGSLTFKIAEGRIGDFVLDRNGRRLALTAIIFGRHHLVFDLVRHLQIRQEGLGEIRIFLVPKDQRTSASDFIEKFDFSGLALQWQVNLIDAPIRTSSGKIRLLLAPGTTGEN